MALRRIGQILVDNGFITEEQRDMLLDEQQQRPGTLLGKTRLDLNMVTEEQLTEAPRGAMGLRVVELGEAVLAQDLLNKITGPMAEMYRVVPVHFGDNKLTVATCDPQNLKVQDELRTLLGYDIGIVVASESENQQDHRKALRRGSRNDREPSRGHRER